MFSNAAPVIALKHKLRIYIRSEDASRKYIYRQKHSNSILKHCMYMKVAVLMMRNIPVCHTQRSTCESSARWIL